MPRIVLSDPATQHRSNGRRRDDREAVQRERHRAFFGRERIGENALLNGRQTAAGQALEHAKDDHHRQRRREPAGYRTDREQQYTEYVEALAADHVREPSADRQDDRVAHEIARRDVGALVETRTKAAGNMPERHVRDGGVEHFHKCRDRHDDYNQPRVERPRRRPGQWYVASVGRGHGYRTVTRGLTERPGASGKWRQSSPSNTIFTGRRCTTFT